MSHQLGVLVRIEILAEIVVIGSFESAKGSVGQEGVVGSSGGLGGTGNAAILGKSKRRKLAGDDDLGGEVHPMHNGTAPVLVVVCIVCRFYGLEGVDRKPVFEEPCIPGGNGSLWVNVIVESSAPSFGVLEQEPLNAGAPIVGLAIGDGGVDNLFDVPERDAVIVVEWHHLLNLFDFLGCEMLGETGKDVVIVHCRFRLGAFGW